MKLERPELPEPHTLEIELTNACSARCTFCPHSSMRRMVGQMDIGRFRRLLAQVDRRRSEFWLNQRARAIVFPRVVFAGLGEPTLHPELPAFVAACRELGFGSRVVTHGGHLTSKLISKLIESGLEDLAISLHTLDPEQYRRVVGLPLASVLPRIHLAVEAARGSGLRVELWRVLPPPSDPRGPVDELAYEDILRRNPDVRILGPSEPWDRDGTVPDSTLPRADDTAQTGIWCHNYFFKESVAWNGDIALCCVDFHRLTAPIDNVFEAGFDAVFEQRRQYFRADHRFAICSRCRKWADQEYAGLYEAHSLGTSRQEAPNTPAAPST